MAELTPNRLALTVIRNELMTWLIQNPTRTPARSCVQIAVDAIDTARSRLDLASDYLETQNG